MNRIIGFLKEVRVELGKVSWPTRRQLTAYSLTVIAITFTLAIFLGLLDSGFAFLLKTFVN